MTNTWKNIYIYICSVVWKICGRIYIYICIHMQCGVENTQRKRAKKHVQTKICIGNNTCTLWTAYVPSVQVLFAKWIFVSVNAYFLRPAYFSQSPCIFFTSHIRLLMQISSAISTIHQALPSLNVNQCAPKSSLLQMEPDLHVSKYVLRMNFMIEFTWPCFLWQWQRPQHVHIWILVVFT